MRHSLAASDRPGRASGSARPGPAPLDALRALYAGYPQPPETASCDFTVRLEPEKPWRRWLQPSVAIRGDYVLPDAAPMALGHGLLAAEMGMNLQMALGQKRYLLLHAATRREGRPGADHDRRIRRRQIDPGGPARRARLAADGRRIRPARPRDGSLHPFPRAVSLKNEPIEVMEARGRGRPVRPAARRHAQGRRSAILRPRAEAIARMARDRARRR